MRHFRILILLALVVCACSNDQAHTLTIAASANMQFAMVELEKAFELETGTDIEVILGSSGKLTAQIIAGAPYDLFLSADEKYPQRLFEEGLSTDSSQIYAYGKLVVWTSLDSALSNAQESDLRTMKMAIANPKTAPYGIAAEQYLKSTGDWGKLSERLVYGESVSQVNQFLTSGVVKVGFTSKSSMYSEAFRSKTESSWTEIPTSMYKPIAQAMVILNTRPSLSNKAQAFYDFVLSDTGQEILKKYGYEPIR